MKLKEPALDASASLMTETEHVGVPLLRVENITLRYGELTAVDDVTFEVREGGRHGLIGPNGAGKSTLFAVLAGSLRATSGRTFFGGEDISGLNEGARARSGLLRTYQHSSLFLQLSVLDNVRLAVERVHGRPLRPWPNRRADRAVTDLALEQIEAVGLADRREAVVDTLSHGERRQLEVALVLACRPRLVLFDEPTAGMSAAETGRFVELVKSLPSTITTVIVEHDLDVVFQLSQHVGVLAAGRLIADGTPEEIRRHEAVNEVYLRHSGGDDPLFGGAA